MMIRTVSDVRALNGPEIANWLIDMVTMKEQLDEIRHEVEKESCDGELYPPQIDGKCPCLYCTLLPILENK
jgi:hypothetical protein